NASAEATVGFSISEGSTCSLLVLPFAVAGFSPCRRRDAMWESQRPKEYAVVLPLSASANNPSTSYGTGRSVQSPDAGTRSSQDTFFSRRSNMADQEMR